MNRLISLFILLLFALPTVLAAFHYHGDTLIHYDCSLCVLNLHSSIVDSHNNQEVSLMYFSYLAVEHESINCNAAGKQFSSRAPPSSV